MVHKNRPNIRPSFLDDETLYLHLLILKSLGARKNEF